MGLRNRHSYRHARIGSRPTGNRNPRPDVVVVCDDTRTALEYLRVLKHEVKKHVSVYPLPAPHQGATPADVVDKAIEAKHRSANNDGEPRDSVWALIDLESEPHKQEQAWQAKQRAEKADIKVALSSPCYEIWTMAHLIDTGEAFHDCAAVVARVKTEWKKRFGTDFPSQKSQADYSKLTPLRGIAVQRTRNRNPSNSQSWTEVFKLIEAILTHAATAS